MIGLLPSERILLISSSYTERNFSGGVMHKCAESGEFATSAQV